MSETLHLPETLREEIIAHCRAEAPNEGCGLIASDGAGRVQAVYPTANTDRSPVSYTVPPGEHFAALMDAEENGLELAGVFHSHPEGDASPSPTDVLAALDPEWVYLIVGLGAPTPEVRAWRIRNQTVDEVIIHPH